MKKFLFNLALIIALISCSNEPEMETGEIRTLQLLKSALAKSDGSKRFINARNVLSRTQVDAAQTPILFVELSSGQNGTLVPYPGKGVGQTWLGADGATITLEQGVVKSSRGMGNDIMGSSSSMPPWAKIGYKVLNYKREISYITGNNKISKFKFECTIEKTQGIEQIEIWSANFQVSKFEEKCKHNNFNIQNFYYVDDSGVVRKSSQFHSKTIGYLITERLDRF